MKRVDFLKGFFAAIVTASVPVKSVAEKKEKEFLFDEIFEIRSGNDRLIYPKKDCELYQKIKELIGKERILEAKYFTCYLGYHSNLIPIKEKYTISDFMPFILATKSYYKKRDCFSEQFRGVFFRMLKETSETMYFDVFLGDVKGQFHS